MSIVFAQNHTATWSFCVIMIDGTMMIGILVSQEASAMDRLYKIGEMQRFC